MNIATTLARTEGCAGEAEYCRDMGEGRLHVVFGVGQVGHAVITRSAVGGVKVRAVSTRRPACCRKKSIGGTPMPPILNPPPTPPTPPRAHRFVYRCLNAPYAEWPERFPPLQRGVLAAAERAGALLVTLENLYGYGPTGGMPMTEDQPLDATTFKVRTRAAMTQELLIASGHAERVPSISPTCEGSNLQQGKGQMTWICRSQRNA